MKIKSTRVLVKPAGFALFSAFAIGTIVVAGAKMMSTRPASIDRYLDPLLWKFDVTGGAIAHVSGDASFLQSPSTKPDQALAARGSDTAAFSLNADKGFAVIVEQTGSKPECVYLRNGVSLDGIRNQSNLSFDFSARAKQASSLCLILREGNQVRWSQMVTIGTSWKDYHIPVSFAKFSSYQGIIAIQMGYQKGKIELKGLRLDSAG